MSVTSLKPDCFTDSCFSSIDLSECDNLKQINYGAFAVMLNVKTIKFNDNLQTLDDPAISACGVFDAGGTGRTKCEGDIVLPLNIKYIGDASFKGMGTDLNCNGVSFV
ncbi:hypothetical protein FACS1894218_4740 [Bacilli bacterium]|nr:hypothetical protein FACS1894218_4740 [Bacilli bacterium]